VSKIEVVAEIGSNHKGIYSLACEYIRQASLCGCDAVKFQLGHGKCDPIRGVTDEWLPDLVHCADEYGIDFFASCFSRDALRSLSFYSDRVKIASRRAFSKHSTDHYNSFVDVAERLFQRVYISDNMGGEKLFNVFCQAKYPTMPWEAEIPPAFNGFGLYAGYSSHTPGIEDALIAASRGAIYIEKHFTLDKTEESIKDNHFSLDVDEMAVMVKLVKGIARIVGVK